MTDQSALARLLESEAPDLYGPRPRNINVPASAYSSFSDDRWNLAPISLSLNARPLSLNFKSIPEQFRSSVKELLHAVMTVDLGDSRQLPHPATLTTTLSALRPFIRWMESKGLTSVTSLTPEHLIAYPVHLMKLHGKRTTTRLPKHLWAVGQFHRYREHIQDSISFNPHLLDGWSGKTSRVGKTRENATPRIPEAVLVPLLSWANRFVTEFAPDIIASKRELDWLMSRGLNAAVEDRVQGADARREAIASVLARYEQASRPLPSNRSFSKESGTVNVNQLVREANVGRATTASLQLIHKTAEKVGIDDDTYLWHEIADARFHQMVGPRMRYADVPFYDAMLVTAAYVIIAFYSGMRDSEIKSLEAGCLSTVNDATGQLQRLRVRGLAFKGERPTGTPATWVVGAQVRAAIESLQQLRAEAGSRYLFAPAKFGGRHIKHNARPIITSDTTIDSLRTFVRSINSYASQANQGDAIPDVDGAPWALTTTQFRRTLAWYIARRPGGSIAGAIQYRHHSVQMFEGYAGTSQSGFRAEVQSEEAIYRGEYLLDVAAGKALISGPAAEIVKSRAEGFAAAATFEGIVVDNPRQLERLVKAKQLPIYPGEHVVCAFDIAKALCIRGSDEQVPDRKKCMPLRCRNVALDDENRAVWEDDLASLEASLAKELSPFIRSRLETQASEIRALLGEVT